MLEERDVIQIYCEGVDLFFRRSHPHRLCGLWDPSSMEIVVYTAHLSSPKDRDLTLVHEYLHASNDIILDIEDSNESVENEAEITLECWPGIAQFIAFVNGKNLPEKGKKL